MPFSTSPTSTLLFLSIFILAFFPNLFTYLLYLPLRPFISRDTATSTIQTNPPLTHPCLCAPAQTCATMSWFQKSLTLPSKSRGSYLVTSHIESSLPEIRQYKVGLLNLFVQHTSCALSLNENWDEDVRADMSDALDRIVPEDTKGKGLYRHAAEGMWHTDALSLRM